MKFLTVHSNGQPEIRTKSHYGGDVTGSDFIKKTQNVLITGAHHSGKSTTINRFYDEAEEAAKKGDAVAQFDLGQAYYFYELEFPECRHNSGVSVSRGTAIP